MNDGLWEPETTLEHISEFTGVRVRISPFVVPGKEAQELREFQPEVYWSVNRDGASGSYNPSETPIHS